MSNRKTNTLTSSVGVEVRERIAKANGISIAYESFGNPKNPTVLMIMGLGMQMVGWSEEFCQTIADEGFQVIRFDNRDTGRSEKLPCDDQPSLLRTYVRKLLRLPPNIPYTLHDMAEDALALLSELNIERAHVVGASMGGMIGQIIAAENSQRVLSLTSMMSSSGAPYLPMTKHRILRHMSKRPAQDRQAIIEYSVESHRLMDSVKFPISAQDRRARIERSHDRSHYREGMERHMLALTVCGDRSRLLRSIDTPTLVIHGTKDPMVPHYHGIDTARKIANAKLELIPDMGHVISPTFSPLITKKMVHHFKNAVPV